MALLVAAPLLAGQAALPVPLEEYGCKWALADAIDPDLRVLDLSGELAPLAHAGEPVICIRSNIVPGPQDWKVGASGRILYLAEQIDGKVGRLAELDYVHGKFGFFLLEGTLTGDEASTLDRRLPEFEAAVRP